jgi:transcriptional regulator with XRE-family HTH domain
MGLGSELRTAREAAGLTIMQVAERSGFSASYISQVERDLANPSIGAVNRMAEAIGIRMRAFFSNGADNLDGDEPATAPDRLPTRVVRQNRRKRLTYPGSNVVFELLCPDLQHKLEILSSAAPPGAEVGETPISHAGEECAVVLKGRMELRVGEEVHLLEDGDSIYFDSAKPHNWRNVGEGDLQVIWVVTPPHF